MNEVQAVQRGVLYLVTCATSSAPSIYHFVPVAQAAGWNVCCILTPQALKFVEISRLEALTSHPVRSEYKHPGMPDILPRADAIVVFPATFNTLNKWALGISDTLAVGLLCEYSGLKKTIVAVPDVTADSGLGLHPAFPRSLRMLRRYGVHILYDPQTYSRKNHVPATVVLETLHSLMAE